MIHVLIWANNMKKYIKLFFVVVMAIIASALALGALVLFMSSITSAPLFVFVVIIIYCLVPKKWGLLGYSIAVVIAAFYLVIMFLSVFVAQPILCLMSCLLSLGTVGLMLREKPLWMWMVVVSFFLITGVYYVFHNNIVGPIGFLISDRPFNTPAQWYHCYRFYWAGVVIRDVTYFASSISVIMLLIYDLYPKIKGYILSNNLIKK